MADKPTVAEMRDRIGQCAAHCGGRIPHDAAMVWEGYLAALIEWGLVTVAEHAELVQLLPTVEGSPVMGVFLGWDNLQR